MTLLAIVLLLIAAMIHAGWNLLTKRRHPTTSFFLLTNTVGFLWLVPVLFWRGGLVAEFSSRVWILVAVTGFFQALYFTALAAAYRRGDLSIAYPIARSSPVIVVMVVTFILGRGGQVSGECVIGILLVAAGCFLVPMRRLRDLRLRNYLTGVCLLAFLAACGTAGYSIIDDEALRLLRAAVPPSQRDRTAITLLYALIEGVSCSAWLAVFVLARRAGRADLRLVLADAKANAALTGFGMFLGYSLVLISMAFVANISYVVAFRQISIPLGAALGWIVLREPCPRPRIAGVAIILAGLVLVAAG